MKNKLFLSFFCISFSIFSQTTHVVNAGMMYFNPSDLIIEQGDTVMWINDGGTHDVNGDINSITNESFNNPETFDSPAISTVDAQIYSHIFTIPGFYNYDCSVGSHALNGMVGTITVNGDCFDDDVSATELAAMWNPNISGCEAAVEYFISVGYPCSTDLSILGMSGTIADICECTCGELTEPVSNTVVDIIVESEDHNTLEIAVITAGLVDSLSAEGPFTVFAPTDAAFDLLAEGVLDAVLADIDLLTAILTHHVASGSLLSADLSDDMIITTLNETELMVAIDDNGVMIDNAMVIISDIMANNGVVHVIDAILMPEEGCQDDNTTIAQYFSSFFITECGSLINYLEANYGYSQEDACAWNGAPMLDLNGLIISDICECSCDTENMIIHENNMKKEPLFTVDLLGQLVSKTTTNKPLFIIFNDGSVQKIILTN
tara:strand:- start:2 stop:1303 length:1302 start_codon:yes stop_codon:yes gene_type:complete